MKKVILTLYILLLVSISSSAQDKFRMGVAFNVQFPMADYTEIAKTGAGGSFLMDYELSEKLALTFTSSYYSLNSKIPEIGTGGKVYSFNIKSIDFFLGSKYYFVPSFYGLLELGTRLLKLHANIYEAVNNNEETASTQYEPYFGGGIGVGYRYNPAPQSSIEFSGIYHYINGDVINFPTISLRVSAMVYL